MIPAQDSPGRPVFDAVVLAGGGARRLSGADKPAVVVGGRPLLDRVLDSVSAADRRIVVGPPRPTRRPVTWCREEPPGAGPVPALAAGLAAVRAQLVLVLAADLPFLDAGVVADLLAAISGATGAVLVDDTGAEQWLVSAWRTPALRAGVAAASGGALRAVMAPLAPVRLPAGGAVPPPWFDCDTPDDLDRAEAWL